MYGKLINGALQYAPTNYKTDDGQLIVNFNKSEDIMKQYGFKEVVDVRLAYDEETQYLRVVNYTDNEDNIVINYETIDRPVIDPPPTVQELDERIVAIEEQLAGQSEILDEEVNN